jgi:antitoxin (DNA-binding transcriptional repressor) of toxin-antitoxin stability system
MAKQLTQRQLRNESGKIMRALDAGESFVVTRNGVAVGELKPLQRHRFVARKSSGTPAAHGGDVRRNPVRRRLRTRIRSASTLKRLLPDERPVESALDLLIAATALAAELPLYTANPTDFNGLDTLIKVTPIETQPTR